MVKHRVENAHFTERPRELTAGADQMEAHHADDVTALAIKQQSVHAA